MPITRVLQLPIHVRAEVLAKVSWAVRITRARPHRDFTRVHRILCSTLLLTVIGLVLKVVCMKEHNRTRNFDGEESISPFNPPTQTQPSPQPRRFPLLPLPHVTCGCVSDVKVPEATAWYDLFALQNFKPCWLVVSPRQLGSCNYLKFKIWKHEIHVPNHQPGGFSSQRPNFSETKNLWSSPGETAGPRHLGCPAAAPSSGFKQLQG